jgi:hypothetical protein
MPRLLHGSLLLLGVVVACSTVPVGVAPVVAEPTVVDVSSPSAVASASAGGALRPVEPPPSRAGLSGTWWEDFESRGGCADLINLEEHGLSLDISAKNCSDDSPYAVSDVRFDGRRLTLRMTTSSEVVIDYDLQLAGDDTFEGSATTTYSSSSNTYRVAWKRGERPTEREAPSD